MVDSYGLPTDIMGTRWTRKTLAKLTDQQIDEGQSYREISHRLGLSKNTVLDIVKRNRAAQLSSNP